MDAGIAMALYSVIWLSFAIVYIFVPELGKESEDVKAFENDITSFASADSSEKDKNTKRKTQGKKK